LQKSPIIKPHFYNNVSSKISKNKIKNMLTFSYSKTFNLLQIIALASTIVSLNAFSTFTTISNIVGWIQSIESFRKPNIMVLKNKFHELIIRNKRSKYGLMLP